MTPSGPKTQPARESPGCQGREICDRLECVRPQPSLKQVPVPTSAPKESALGRGPERMPSLSSDLGPQEHSEKKAAKCSKLSRAKPAWNLDPKPTDVRPVRGASEGCCRKHREAQGAPRSKDTRDQCLCVRSPTGSQQRLCLPKMGRGLLGPKDSLSQPGPSGHRLK